jgi:predicted NBD/HSP70 family sugar kinase
MYLGIDVGGTKTLLAVFSSDGKIEKEYKFPTPKKYPDFLTQLQEALDRFNEYHITTCCCAIPGKVDRQKGVGLVFGNLAWRNVPIKNDLAGLLDHAKILVENDANLAGLHEALIFHKRYKKVLYITVGTGIGDGIITDGKIDPDFADSESGQMVLDYGGKLTRWEDIASGRALVERYGKTAREIDDPKIWQQFAKDLSLGLVELVATLQPDVIIIGGGIGTHFNKYADFLKAELKRHESPMVSVPPLVQANKPEEAVIYGCYDFIQHH